ncbi:Retinol dehydrogenase 7 [Halotydeus destructor]|nr:Retinol dehydrogenase 7 [Halotydeus destructor]
MIARLPRVDGKDKIILITGCDSGFGMASALRLNKLGFTVYATCLEADGPGGRHLAKEAKYPEKMNVVRMDITKDEQIELVVRMVQGDVDNGNGVLFGLLNNAGIGRTGHIEWGEFNDHFRASAEVNALGHVRVTRAFLPLIRSSGGRVVNISSTAGRYATVGVAAYSMAKAALSCFTETLRREMVQFNVKVIEIDPMFYPTAITSIGVTKDNMERTWRTTGKQVRAAYGNKYDRACKTVVAKVVNSFLMNNSIDSVVDSIEDAFTSACPDYLYSCMGLSQRPCYWLYCNILPQEMCEIASHMFSVMIQLAMYFDKGDDELDT